MNFPEAGFLCNKGGASGRDDFAGENVGIRKIVGFFEAFVPEPEDVEAGLVAVMSSSQFERKVRVPFSSTLFSYRSPLASGFIGG